MSPRQFLPAAPPDRLRLLVAVSMGLVLALALFRLWCVKGLVRTIRIDGGSMAETLYGNHFRVTCVDCGITFRCDADAFPADRRAVCPNCGFRDNELRDADLRRGDRVLVDTWPYLWSSPRRGDVVMLVEPLFHEAEHQNYVVKRVVGLPGEGISLSEGDLWIDASRHKKSLSEMRELALLVHNNDYLPRSLPDSPRWKAASSQSGWRPVGTGFHLAPKDAFVKDLDWINFEHWRCDGNPLPRTAPAVVLDNDSYNQAETREPNPAHDLMLSCRVKLEKNTEFAVRLRDDEAVLQVWLDLTRSLAIASINDRSNLSVGLPRDLAGRTVRLQAALIDCDLLLAIDDRTLLRMPYERRSSTERQPRASSPLQIGAAAGEVELTELSVYRDIYYYEPRGMQHSLPSQGPLPAGRFFLLGDNPPISIDSRQWPAGGIPRQQIMGKVAALGRR